MSDYVLIAEDDEVLRGVYMKRLSAKGFQMKVANDGEEALRMIALEAPRLFICDVHMPKADAFQVLKSLPKASRQFPIILLTNFDQAEFRAQAKELGADGYLVKKDMTLAMLVKEMERVLKK